MTPDQLSDFAGEVRTRLGAVLADVMAEIGERSATPAEAASAYERIKLNIMLLAAFMHMNGDGGDNFAGFVEAAERAYLCALLPVDGRLAP